MHEPETPEVAAARAGQRWRYIASGLGLLLATNIVNVGLNAADVRSGSGMTCIAVAGEGLTEQAVEKRVDRSLSRLRLP